MSLIDFLPLAATACAVPQLVPQLARLVRTRRPDGVSPAWASLTAASNLGWLAYFTSTGLWTAAVPSTTCALVAGGIVVALGRAGAPVRRGVAIGTTWLAVLIAAVALAGPTGLGGVLAGAFVLQVVPSLRTAWSTTEPVGVSRATWVLIGAEVVCWGAIGLLDARPPLIALGVTGVTAAAAMLVLTRAGRLRAAPAPAPAA
ncbi:hypothetical protein [Euzebya sp.]|uniref:hypothetical protein n=1 Tax=Euzebya sp. TaxID=1971409 RepID=UPI003519D7C4